MNNPAAMEPHPPEPPALHYCSLPGAGCMAALDYCSENPDGTLEVGNGEYSSQVNFCPVCGYKAKVPVKP